MIPLRPLAWCLLLVTGVALGSASLSHETWELWFGVGTLVLSVVAMVADKWIDG